MRRLTGIVAVLALAGCGSDVETAAKAVLEKVDNPKTARFANVRTLSDGNICGQVRTKDASGNFGGYQSYVALKKDGHFEVILDPAGTDPRIRNVCGTPAPAEEAADVTPVEGQRWDVQVDPAGMGALSDMSSRLVERGYSFNIVKIDGEDRIVMGPFASREEAAAKQSQLQAEQGIQTLVVKHKD